MVMSHDDVKSSEDIFPKVNASYILSFQFSSWYPKFASLSIKSTIIKPLSREFVEYLHSDSVFVPEGSEDVPAQSSLSDDEDDEAEDNYTTKRFTFHDLDLRIRGVIKEYGAVFPKLNFSSPKDASWVLPASSPLKCTTPADVYLLLKSSDFISHDIDISRVFEGCKPIPAAPIPDYALELVLRKWYSIDRSRELRCFVRNKTLIGISQRDTNFYEFYADPATKIKVCRTVQEFWRDKIKVQWDTGPDYAFDLLLTRDLSRAHIIDFNPYAPRTDPLLFTYPELQEVSSQYLSSDTLPELRVIDSRAHPAAARNAPVNQHNMVPFEALSMSGGRGVEDFADVLADQINKAMRIGAAKDEESEDDEE